MHTFRRKSGRVYYTDFLMMQATSSWCAWAISERQKKHVGGCVCLLLADSWPHCCSLVHALRVAQCAGMRPAPLPFSEGDAPEGSLAVARRDVIAPSKAIAVRPADSGVVGDCWHWHTAYVSIAQHAMIYRAGPDCASTAGISTSTLWDCMNMGANV